MPEIFFFVQLAIDFIFFFFLTNGNKLYELRNILAELLFLFSVSYYMLQCTFFTLSREKNTFNLNIQCYRYYEPYHFSIILEEIENHNKYTTLILERVDITEKDKTSTEMVIKALCEFRIRWRFKRKWLVLKYIYNVHQFSCRLILESCWVK